MFFLLTFKYIILIPETWKMALVPLSSNLNLSQAQTQREEASPFPALKSDGREKCTNRLDESLVNSPSLSHPSPLK